MTSVEQKRCHDPQTILRGHKIYRSNNSLLHFASACISIVWLGHYTIERNNFVVTSGFLRYRYTNTLPITIAKNREQLI